MWSAVMENATVGTAAAGMRESNPAWRNRDLPPTPAMEYTKAKVISWLNRNPNSVDDARMDKVRGHTFLIAAVNSNNEELVAELLARGASVDIKAQGKAALHFAAVHGHSNCARLLLQYGASTSLRVDVDDTDYTECDGMTALEIVESKITFARDPMRERLAEMQQMLQRAEAAREAE